MAREKNSPLSQNILEMITEEKENAVLNKLIKRSPQSIALNFTSVTLADTLAFPPDSDGAVGPSQYFTVVNGRLRTHSKYTGLADGALDTGLDNFFNSVRNGQFTTDPKVRFDQFSDHWFIVCINEGSGPNRLLLAVSNERDIQPTTIWRIFFFDVSQISPVGDAGLFFDFPTLGIDNSALYIGGNLFDSGGSFVNCTVFVIQKVSMNGLGPLVATAFRDLIVGGVGPFTPQGVDNYDSTATQGFILGLNSTSDLALRIISNPGSANPTISGNILIAIPDVVNNPLNVPQAGSATQLDPIDLRLSHTHILNNQMWTSHNIGVNSVGGTTSPDRDGCRFYQINMTNPLVPVLVQNGTLFDSTASVRYFWIPSVMSSGQGHMALGCSTCGASFHADAATVGRLSGDGLGTLESPVIYTSSSFIYNPSDGATPHRWGDFSITTLDHQDNMTMWTIQEFCNATNSYGCQVAKLLAPPAATIVSTTPSSVPRGSLSALLTINGSSVSGSGFYDSPVGFEKRLTVQISGGVIVNSVTFINPTTINLTINTVFAAPGLQTVRVENPDGQQSLASVLTIL
jgi:hypothetical protein